MASQESWVKAPLSTLPTNRKLMPSGIPEGKLEPGVARRDTVYRRLLGVADISSAALALFFGVVVLARDDQLIPTALLALPLVLLVGKTAGLYDRDEHLLKKTTLEEVPTLFQVATLYTLVLWLAEGVFVDGALGRGQLIGLWGLLFVSMASCRAGVRMFARTRTTPERCLVVGDAQNAERVRRKLEQIPSCHATVVGRVALEDEDANGDADPSHDGPPVLGTVETLGVVLLRHDVDRAILAPSMSDSERVLDVVRLIRALGIKVSVLPRLFEVVGSSVEFDDIDGLMLLGLRRDGLSQSSQVLKRGTDLFGASVMMVLLASLMLAFAVAIKLNSPGTVLFRQKRIGREGEEFEIFKFRTMVDDAELMKTDLRALNEADGLFKIANDPRVTRVGRLLRRTSLDELPQLINVLRGDMSLVGPRPLVPDEDRRIEGWDRRRLHVRPGITGPWQVFGSSRIPLREMVKIDYAYGTHWSLWLDVKILLRTVPHALLRRGM